jgi:hypothetical protein
MSITWDERPHSLRSTTNPQSITLGYVLTGTDIRTVANALAVGYSVGIYSGLYRSNIALEKIALSTWNVDVTWGPYNKKEPADGDFRWRFSTGGGTIHITQALSHIEEYGTGAVDHKGTIGINLNGDVEGVDIPGVMFKWQEERRMLVASYGFAYALTLGALTYHVNNATFRGLAAGSVLFEDATGEQSQKDPLYLDVSYSFLYSPNVTGLAIGDITGIAKLGHQYLWLGYGRVDPGGGAAHLATQPSQANVEQVFYTGDFSLLGIGTT